jgi:hypothetical protein
MACELAFRTSVLVGVGRHWWAFDGPATAQTAQRRPRNDLQTVATRSAGVASRRASFARPGRARVGKVERPTGRTTFPTRARSGCLWCAAGRGDRLGIPESPGSVGGAPAAGGPVRVVGPEVLPAGGPTVRPPAASAIISRWSMGGRCGARQSPGWTRTGRDGSGSAWMTQTVERGTSSTRFPCSASTWSRRRGCRCRCTCSVMSSTRTATRSSLCRGGAWRLRTAPGGSAYGETSSWLRARSRRAAQAQLVSRREARYLYGCRAGGP